MHAADDLSDPPHNLAEPMSDAPSDIPEDTDIELNDPLDENRIFTPPPRIAARFYRPTNSRRKSSAASSRRNSITSAHSHQSHVSNLSYHGGPQSNHIAQHLRRASIIESRKARIADRAAHAEKVRLRAALAKAAPRSSNNSEERALAAQQAREKNLAEIVANCAEEVKRAKGIAATMKEKREADGINLRREMQTRLAAAEVRREEILNRGNKHVRSPSAARDAVSIPRKSLSPSRQISETLSEGAAAGRIQQKWRAHMRWKAFKNFADLGLSIEGVRDTSFEDVSTLLAEERVLLGTAQMLRICGLKEGESGSVNEMTAVRTFLSAFLILGHPTQVLSSKGDNGELEQVGSAFGALIRRDDLANPQLQDLVAKARDLLISFEHVFSRLTTTNNYTPPPAQLTTLSESYATFFNAFIAWKARDSNTLIDMMVLQFVELDSIWQTVKDSTEEAVTGTYKEGIRENQMKLMLRIKRLAGPAEGKRLITNAIREARKSRTKKPVGDSKPRAADGMFSRGSVLGDLAASEHAVRSVTQTLTPPATPRQGVQAEQNRHVDELRTSNSVIPDNRIVVHELTINKEYRIEMADCLEQRGAVNQIIFKSMRRDVNAGRSDQWVLAMAENIKGKLQRLLTPGNSLHNHIGESLDLELIAQELKTGGFSYEKFFSFMGSILPKLCAPFRDDEVKILVSVTLQTGDVVDRLESLMHFIDLMQLDYANFMLQQSAPELIKHAITYETKRFAEDLDRHVHDLSRTELWWKASRTKVLAEAARRDPEGINLPRTRPTPEKFYAQLLADVFTDINSRDSPPETLQLDSKRMSRIKTELRNIVTTGAILLQTKNLMKRDVRSQWKTEASRILTVLASAETAADAHQGIQAALESLRNMPSATKTHISEIIKTAVANLYDNRASSENPSIPMAHISEPVMRLLLVRLRTHILGRLSAMTASEKVRTTTTASESLATLGLPEFVSQVGKVVDEMARVGVVDRESHAIWYEIVAKRVEGLEA